MNPTAYSPFKARTIVEIIVCILASIPLLGQYSEAHLHTDSSEIEIIRNSVYHIFEETYHHKDSVWYSVHFIKDTTKLCHEGWTTKTGRRLGVWQNYNEEGVLMYTRDHDRATCVINKEQYPYFDLMERIKLKADSLIITTYSQAFFDKYVRFDFDFYAYKGQWVTYENGAKRYWSCDYLGTWTIPLKGKPNTFLFRYDVKTNDSEWNTDMISIQLDTAGNYIGNSDFSNVYGFEQVSSPEKTFLIDKTKAEKTAIRYGLKTTDPSCLSGYLSWEKFNTAAFYNGQFRYYLTELTDEIKDIRETGRSQVTYKYNVYVFNPWTGEFVEIKKMKNIHSWGKNSGNWTGLLPDNG
ncbi:MAG: hypothetical protein JNJ57_16415 [Saprospiraceae bacterium]|nr:hypothetical protein [Saprospiraceae bacterium]